LRRRRIGHGTVEERLKLLVEAVRLRELGYSYTKIGNLLCVGEDTVSSWVRGERPKRISSYNPDLSPSPNLAYLVGFYLGDGRSAGSEKKVRFKLADRLQLEYVNTIVAGILKRAPKPIRLEGPFYAVDYDSVALSDYLERPLCELMIEVDGYGNDFLQGFYDAEGYVSGLVDRSTRRVNGISIGLANTRLEYLLTVSGLISGYGLHGRVKRTHRAGEAMTIRGRTWVRRNAVYHLVLQGVSYARVFQNKVGFRNPGKTRKLADLITVMEMAPEERYAWFTTHYRKEGWKWVRMDK